MADTKIKRTYLFAVGRRKTAVARVRLYKKGDREVTVNEKTVPVYFQTAALQGIALAPLNLLTGLKDVSFSIKTLGGGKAAQAEAVRLGISRALLLLDPEYKAVFKKAGLLTRDSRKKERKKPGLKRARRAPQWSKR